MIVSCVEFQQYLYDSLWDAWRARLLPRVNQVLLWISVARNRKCETILGGSLLYRILTKSVTRFMDYMEKPYMVLRKATNMAENQISQTISGESLPC
jgi:hypothetical protein